MKENDKLDFLLELLRAFKFIDIKVIEKKKEKKVEEKYNFFQSAGLLEGTDIDANELRKKAWKIQ